MHAGGSSKWDRRARRPGPCGRAFSTATACLPVAGPHCDRTGACSRARPGLWLSSCSCQRQHRPEGEGDLRVTGIETRRSGGRPCGREEEVGRSTFRSGEIVELPATGSSLSTTIMVRRQLILDKNPASVFDAFFLRRSKDCSSRCIASRWGCGRGATPSSRVCVRLDQGPMRPNWFSIVSLSALHDLATSSWSRSNESIMMIMNRYCVLRRTKPSGNPYCTWRSRLGLLVHPHLDHDWRRNQNVRKGWSIFGAPGAPVLCTLETIMMAVLLLFHRRSKLGSRTSCVPNMADSDR